MSQIYQIVQELNKENGSNYKIQVLKNHKDNELLETVLKMTYDRVAYTYGITMAQVDKFDRDECYEITLEEALKELRDKLNTREVTGHAALQLVSNIIRNLTDEDADIVKKIINRDLRINVGRTNINKVFKGLIIKPVYNRCAIFTIDEELGTLDKKGNPKIKKGTARDIVFPAPLNLKADGTYREFVVADGKIKVHSRSGETYNYPVIESAMLNTVDGVYTGELTIKGLDNRSESNGLINSDNPPHDDIIVEFWDYITLEEYAKAGLKNPKNPCTTIYKDRWDKLKSIINDVDSKNVQLIPSIEINSLEEAYNQTSEWMKMGYEGAVLKDYSGVFKDGTSKHQLKMKIEFDIEARIVGFTEGKAGTKRAKTFGAVVYKTDDGLIRGKVSGFTDKQLADFNNRRDELIDQIITISANDLTQARGNDYYALSHPRFTAIRNDKTETDTLERAQDTLEMAKLFRK